MESECECCGQQDTWYAFGMCRACIKSLPTLRAKVERLEKALVYVAYYGLDDCEMASRDMRSVAKAALEGKQE